ncbi:Mitomycin radical oxidase [Streptomyces sp. YIM 130001]|uniref:FAD-binding oxidoreductase n=1 Tax=Streptomyces sp. YIM 130001 TaxID=2259644 RepID=UPI000E64D8BA|nr:FAD-binding oxidoreductase [Streptomyces sp. YIM 130001]RII19482.1 Mitomycin radical oxidase [Streptomyces sp. YIM 130001]
MNAKTPITASTLGTTGAVLLPDDPAYDEERSGFQAGYSHRPALTVVAAGPGDVRAAVAHAAGNRLPVAVQSTGHGLSAPADGGVLVSTRRLTDLHVDPATRTARAGAGVRWSEVIEAAAEHGLAPLNGSAPGVGVVGYLTGGGLGILGRQFGYAADHVRAFDLVTADGALRRVTPDSEPDLFWAVRGGGGNFGVVTSVEFDLVPLPTVYGGVLAFDGEHADEVLAAYPGWARSLPEELTSSLALMTWPDAPFAPEPFRGRHVTQLRIAFTGDPAEGERLVEPLRKVAPRLVDSLREMPYAESHTIHSDPPHPHPYDGDNALVTDLSPEALRTLAGPEARESAVVQIKHLSGAFGREPRVPNAVGHRDAEFLVSVLSALFTTDRETARAAHGRILAPLEPHRIGRQLNHLFGEFGEDRVRDAYERGTWERLTRVKGEHDPGNLFRLNYNIPPSGDAG